MPARVITDYFAQLPRWPWKSGTRLRLLPSGELVILKRVEPPTRGLRYQMVHTGFDMNTYQPYKWRGRILDATIICTMLAENKAEVLK